MYKKTLLTTYIVSSLFIAGSFLQASALETTTQTDVAATTTATVVVEKKPEVSTLFKEVLNFFGSSFLSQSNGITGEIVSINAPYFVVLDKKDISHDALISVSTKILEGKTGTTSLDVGDMVIVIGKTNKKSVIEAKLIKLLQKRVLATTTPSATTNTTVETNASTTESTTTSTSTNTGGEIVATTTPPAMLNVPKPNVAATATLILQIKQPIVKIIRD